MITLIYAGLSQGELETLYKMFEEFGADEREEDPTDEYVSMISLQLPLEYNADFFINFVDRWEDLKALLKNIKWRRGNKTFKLILAFNGKPEVKFVLSTSLDRVMNKALDTVEYQVDNISIQLDNVMRKDIESISYRFDEKIYRWFIDRITNSNKQVYQYINNKWVEI